MTPLAARGAGLLAGALCLALAGCGTQVYRASGTGAAATASPAPSRQVLEAQRPVVARQYWPATSVVMKAVPSLESRFRLKLHFLEATGTYAACDVTGGGTGLHYQVAVVIAASGPPDEDPGALLGEATKVVERDLTAAGWGLFAVTQGVTVAAERDGVSLSLDSEPAASETENSMADGLVYFLSGPCVPVAGVDVTPAGGGSEAGGGPDAGPPPGGASAGDGLPPVDDTYGLGPAHLPPLK